MVSNTKFTIGMSLSVLAITLGMTSAGFRMMYAQTGGAPGRQIGDLCVDNTECDSGNCVANICQPASGPTGGAGGATGGTTGGTGGTGGTTGGTGGTGGATGGTGPGVGKGPGTTTTAPPVRTGTGAGTSSSTRSSSSVSLLRSTASAAAEFNRTAPAVNIPLRTNPRSGIQLLEPIGNVRTIPTAGMQGLGVFGYYFNLLYPWVIGMGAAIAVMMGIVGGLQIIMAGGDSSKRSAGVQRFMMSIGGLLLVLLSATIMRVLNPSFFK